MQLPLPKVNHINIFSEHQGHNITNCIKERMLNQFVVLIDALNHFCIQNDTELGDHLIQYFAERMSQSVVLRIEFCSTLSTVNLHILIPISLLASDQNVVAYPHLSIKPWLF